jgi:hypothetical protein
MFSDWARVVKAIARLKRRVKEAMGLKLRSSEATSIEERREAELTIIKMVQEAAFSHEIHNLRHQKDIKTKASKLHFWMSKVSTGWEVAWLMQLFIPM